MSNDICNNYTFLIKESISSEFILSRTCQQFSSIILHFKLKKKVIPFFFWSIFNGIYVHTFKFVYKLWNAYQNGTKTMNAHWKLIFSLKCLTMYFLKSFLKNETSNMPFVSKSQDQCSFSNSPTLLFWTTFDWYQPLKTKKNNFPKTFSTMSPNHRKL